MPSRNKSKVIVGKYMPYYYAGASLDFNLIHIDHEFARANGLPGIILQGMCTMGLTVKHVINTDHPSKLQTLKVRFLFPVLPEDELNIESHQDNKEISIEVRNQNGDKVLTGQATIR